MDKGLEKHLKDLSAIGGGSFKFEGALQEQQPVQTDSEGSMQIVGEHWRWNNCKVSMSKKGIYEAPGSLF